jgi:hypothetical protein
VPAGTELCDPPRGIRIAEGRGGDPFSAATAFQKLPYFTVQGVFRRPID